MLKSELLPQLGAPSVDSTESRLSDGDAARLKADLSGKQTLVQREIGPFMGFPRWNLSGLVCRPIHALPIGGSEMALSESV
jgi:hypothetical protein